MGIREEENRVVVQNTQLDQRAKEDDLLKFFKEHQWIFAQSWIIYSYWPPLILVEVLKEYLNRL